MEYFLQLENDFPDSDFSTSEKTVVLDVNNNRESVTDESNRL